MRAALPRTLRVHREARIGITDADSMSYPSLTKEWALQ
jgi:hypothetical protein